MFPPPSPATTACVPNPAAVCTMDWRPVCGKNGRTYSNMCGARAACQHEGATEGECAISSPSPAACVPHTGPCTREFRPMCGKDGVTYANPCLARNACQHDATEGPCPDLSPPPSTGSAWGSMLVGGAPIGNGGNAGGHYTGSDSQLLGGWAAQTKIGA